MDEKSKRANTFNVKNCKKTISQLNRTQPINKKTKNLSDFDHWKFFKCIKVWEKKSCYIIFTDKDQ